MTATSTLALLDQIASSTETAPIVHTTKAAPVPAVVVDQEARARRFHTWGATR